MKIKSKAKDLYKDAEIVALEEGYSSSALLQRKLKIPYETAAELMNLLEEKGIVGPRDWKVPQKWHTNSKVS